MARRIYLHIGVMKSATSYLQELFEQNRTQLAAGGLYWCPEDLRYEAVREALGKGQSGPTASGCFDQLVEDLNRHRGDAVLSNELLAGLGRLQIRKLLGALPVDEVHVVITARDLARIIPSHWQTTIKNGRTWSWSDFAVLVCADSDSGYDSRPDGTAQGTRADTREDTAEDAGEAGSSEPVDVNRWFWRRHDLPSIVERWSSAVPLERITMVTVPSRSSDLSIVAARFGSVVGADARQLDHPETKRNPTLGAHSVELLRRLNGPLAQQQLDDPEHRFERALGGALAAHAELEPRFALTQSQQDWVGRRVRAMIDQVAARGLGVVGDLDDLVPDHSPPPGSVDPADTTDAELLAAAARGLAGLAPVFNELRSERNELRRVASPPDGSAGASAQTDSSPGSLRDRIRRLRGKPTGG